MSCNQSPIMKKELRKAIMTSACLVNEYNKDSRAGDLFAYKRQKSLHHASKKI